MKRLLTAMLTILCLALACGAQEYRFEVGPTLGVAGYLGDVNQSKLWAHPGPAGGAMLRYIKNSRWAFKAGLTYARLSGSTRDADVHWPGGLGVDFTSNVYDLASTAEFNFFHFGSGPRYKNLKRLSPYMVLGLGAVLSTTGDAGTGLSLTLPMGVGVKYKLKERLNLSFEFTMRKDFGDNLEQVSDPYGIRHGFAKNTDWHSLALFTVTYEFSKRCTKCHYVE